MAVKNPGYRPIPRKVFTDEKVCGPGLMYASRADHELTVLENLMSFNKGLKQLQREVELDDGTRIICRIAGGVKSAQIIPFGGGKKDQQEEKMCLCNCNFSAGQIVRVDDLGDHVDYKNLTVIVCVAKNRYVLFRDVLGTDFTGWVPGWPVIVIPYNENIWDCCNFNFNATGCKPIVDTENDPHREQWRPVVRVIPAYSLLSKWYNR